MGEAQCRPMGFWNKAMPSAEESHMSLEKQLLVCCWALEKMKHLTMGHEVTMQLELSIINWVLSGPLNHKVRQTQNNSLQDEREVSKGDHEQY